MGPDSPLLPHEQCLDTGGEWEFPGTGWTFLWTMSGEAYLMGPTPTRPVSAGMVVVHGGTHPVRFRASQIGAVTFRWFRLDPTAVFGVFTLLERLRLDHPERADPPLPWLLPRDSAAAQLFAKIPPTDEASSLRQRARLLELVSAILSPPPFRSITPVGSPRDARDRLEELLHRMTDIELLMIPMEELARRCRCETRRLLTIYRERFGESLPGRQREWRRMRACALLSQTEGDLASVAKACGYEEVDAFRAWFRRDFGMSPSEWRRQGRDRKIRTGSSIVP